MASQVTETSSERFRTVETWPDAAVLSAIVDAQAAAVSACRTALPALARAAGLFADTLRSGGRIAYAGAGSSGIIALLDALELPGTYGIDLASLPVLLAGGGAEAAVLDAGAEDDTGAARQAVEAAGLGAGDLVIAVSASGSTPYTLAVAQAAGARGARVIGLACNAEAPLLTAADVPVAIVAGPEIVAGSTRMNAGTAQKCALNMISTLAAMRLGHVYGGQMVNVRAGNAKLRRRAAGIVARAAGVDEAAAAAAIEASGGEVKPAVLVARGIDPGKARAALAAAGGDLHGALGRTD